MGLLLLVVIELALVVLIIAGFWKMFEKAAQPGWAAIIPIYNTYIMCKIGGKPGWWVLLMLIPIVNIVFAVWLANMISKSFGKDEGFTVGLVLLGFVFYPILGFGKATYLGPYGDPVAFQAARNPKFDFDQSQPQG
jgi:hypothetical protein